MRVIVSTIIVLFSLFANAQDEVGLSREIIYTKTARAINPPESSYKTKNLITNSHLNFMYLGEIFL